MLLRKCANLLTEEGILVLHDFFLEEKKEQHQISALYTLDWLMQGSLFNASVQEIENWLTKAGLRLHREVRYSSIPTSIIIAKKAV
jgi:cyclopropane fatty-acyl-phospholipid synthase-like methyltransferase